LRTLYEVKSELETVYITSSGDKYIKEMDAFCAEAQIQQTKESKKRWRDNIMGIMELLLKVIGEENWGLFYKNEPMRSLNTKDGGTLYEVNSVDLDEIERVLIKKLESTNQREVDNWKKHTAHPSPTERDLGHNEN
jgi:uncharacterized protein YllA (UPF0747 family)